MSLIQVCWRSLVNSRLLCLIPFTLLLLLCFTATSCQNDFKLEREHVGVWFGSPLKLEYKYTKENLAEMIKIVAERFGTITTPSNYFLPKLSSLESLNNSFLLIPGVAAEHNRQQNELQIKTIVSFTHSVHRRADSWEEKSMRNLEIAKETADNANLIFPGTVETLLLHDYPLFGVHWKENGQVFSEGLKKTKQFLNEGYENGLSPQYKLGAEFSDYVCKNLLAFNPALLREILENLDMALLHTKLGDHPDLEPIVKNKMLLTSLQSSEGILKELKPSLEVVPMIYCSQPKNRDYLEVYEFLQCWQFMSDWARDNNRTVIMIEAFDRYRSDSESYSSREFPEGVGWWRMISENLTHVYASSFHEKASERIPCLKSGDKTAVYFDHNVRYHQDLTFYAQQEIEAMLELVATRFSAILMSNHPSFQTSSSSNLTWIAHAVAGHNKKNQKHKSFKPLTIISTFRCCDNTTGYPYAIFDDVEYDRSSNLELILKIVESANDIFTGTVTFIVYDKIQLFRWDSYPIAKFEATIQNLKIKLENLFENKTSDIPLGVIVEMSACSTLLTYFQLVSQWFKVLIVDVTGSVEPSPREPHPNSLIEWHPNSSLQNLVSNWTACRDSFLEKYPELEIQLAVDCSKVVRQNFSSEDFVRCWQIVSEWGAQNHVGVVLKRAFDKYERYSKAEHVGWWRLKSKSEVTISKESFLEKYIEVPWYNTSHYSLLDNKRFEDDVQCDGDDVDTAQFLALFIGEIVIFTGLVWLLFYLYSGVLRQGSGSDHYELQILEG